MLMLGQRLAMMSFRKPGVSTCSAAKLTSTLGAARGSESGDDRAGGSTTARGANGSTTGGAGGAGGGSSGGLGLSHCE
jgi:hypothetical protein